MVLPASSKLWFRPLEKVGQSWVLMTIFGRVLCPLQPSCLPSPHAARALMLSFFPCLVYSRFSRFSSYSTTRTVFTCPLVSLFPLFSPHHLFCPLPCHTHAFTATLSFLPKPGSSAHPPPPCFTPLFCLFCSFPSHYFLCSPFSLILPRQEAVHI